VKPVAINTCVTGERSLRTSTIPDLHNRPQ
jgi:hypothetical protein